MLASFPHFNSLIYTNWIQTIPEAIWYQVRLQFTHIYELNLTCCLPDLRIVILQFTHIYELNLVLVKYNESFNSLIYTHSYIRIESANINHNLLVYHLFFIQFIYIVIYWVDQFPQLSDVKPPVTHKMCYFLVQTYQLFHNDFMFAPNY